MIYMIQNYRKIFNAQELIDNNFPKLIELFVQYYGEDAREDIVKSFQKALIIPYYSPQALEKFLNSLELDLSKKMLNQLLVDEKLSLNYNYLFENYSLKQLQFMPIKKFHELYKMHKASLDGRLQDFYRRGYSRLKDFLDNMSFEEYCTCVHEHRVPKFLENITSEESHDINYFFNEENCRKEYLNTFIENIFFCRKIDPSIDSNNFEEKLEEEPFQKLLSFNEKLDALQEEYQNQLNFFQPYYQVASDSKALYNQLSDKYFKEYLRANLHFVKPEERKSVEEYLEGKKEFSVLSQSVQSIFGDSLFGTSLLEFFQEEKEECLENDSWDADYVKMNRIFYFNHLGLDLGDDYEQYVSSSEAQKIWPSSEMISQFFQIREQYIGELKKDYFGRLACNKKWLEKIHSLNLLFPNHGFDFDLYQTDSTSVSPNIQKTEEGYGLFSLLSLCVIDSNGSSNHLDHYLIHELNHIYESYLIDSQEEKFQIISGWDDSTLFLDKENESAPIYKLFNEVVNELISQEICGIMKQEKCFLFDDETTFQSENVTSYEHEFFLVKEFFEEFKPIIIASRQKGNVQLIWDAVGKENFDELNILINVFEQYFSGQNYYYLMDLLENKENTVETNFYYELIKRKDEILERMREYQRSSSINYSFK